MIAHPHAFESSTLLGQLDVELAKGLSDEEAARRSQEFGPNAVPVGRGKSVWRSLLEQFASLVVVLLAIAASIAFAMGDRLEAMAILIVLALNAVIGFVTERSAEGALRALRREAKTFAHVRREGRERQIDAKKLVPGDLVILSAGDRVPADARLLQVTNLRVQEAALTGESAPVDKEAEPIAHETPLAERCNMVYQGTAIATGRALAVVVATGRDTELGRIGRLLDLTETVETPLHRKLEGLGKSLAMVVLALAALIFLLGVARGEPAIAMAEVSISLAVAAIPEGLPAVTTFVLALGVLRMARRKAIVRRLAAVEGLGATTVIATDKTGTLTQNRMTVRAFGLPYGEIVGVEARPAVIELLEAACLCNDATDKATGDPTESSFLEAAQRVGMDFSALRQKRPRVFEIPFDASTRRMISVHAVPGVGDIAYLKGSLSAVLDLCAGLSDDERKCMFDLERQMANQALRVLAIGRKCGGEELDGGFEFLGIAGLIDPPRKGAADAVRSAHEAGIRVVMLTGDGAETACAIAKELRLAREGPVHAMHAREIAGLDRDGIAAAAAETDVFARVSPEDKLRIVQALRHNGGIVAVTGDGVNDAPALKQADVGVAMGERGTEVAREAADVVLTDDNFATIVAAIESGRAIGDNVRKIVHFLLAANLAEVVLLMATTSFGLPLPLSPLGILWINLVTDVFPAFALAVEPADLGIMRRPPRDPKAPILSQRTLAILVAQGLICGVAALSAYLWALHVYGAGAHARAEAMLAVVFVEIAVLLIARSDRGPVFKGLFKSPAILLAIVLTAGLQAIAVNTSLLAQAFGLAPTTLVDWSVACLASFGALAILWGGRWLSERSRDTSQSGEQGRDELRLGPN